MTYPQRIQSTLTQKTGLCVGLDPSTALLESWGLSDDIKGLSVFCERMTEVCIAADVGFVKPQSAFYERFGWQGMKLLTALNKNLREAKIITLLDCKCGDIGSTVAAYADAYLSATDLSKYDAITVNPFLGYNTHQPFIDKIKAEAVGLFIVVRSSNEGAAAMQMARVSESDRNQTVAQWLAEHIARDNAALFGENQRGAIGAVIGATLDYPAPLLDVMPNAFFLCPGIGAQGATVALALEKFKPYTKQCIFPVSRGISFGVPDTMKLLEKVKNLKEELGVVYA